MTTDPNLIRCRCGETAEAHEECDCTNCEIDEQVERLCPDGTGTFREETDADRQAQWAGARGL